MMYMSSCTKCDSYTSFMTSSHTPFPILLLHNITGISKGVIVTVASCTVPGINIQGGTARVTKVHNEGSNTKYDVKYVVGGGGEKMLDEQFITMKIEETARPRRASSESGNGNNGGELSSSTVAPRKAVSRDAGINEAVSRGTGKRKFPCVHMCLDVNHNRLTLLIPF